MRRRTPTMPFTRRRADGQRGYTTVLVALALTVLIVFVSFSVDIGSYYNRAAQIQRAADAAALAGVVWMPDFNKASAEALIAAERNGFKSGVNGITVTPQEVPGNNRQLRVVIDDNNVKQYFSKIVYSGQKIGRSATAEYVLPVPMGSPKNVLGTGDLLSGSDRENFWNAVNGYCAGHESGDKKLAYYESYTTSSYNGSRCNNGSAVTDSYDPTGYLYAIEMGASAASLTLQVYDGGYNRSGSSMDLSLGSGTQTVNTAFDIYALNTTPLDLSNLTLLTTVDISTNDTSYQNQWKTLYTWSNPQPGTYYVRVRTPGPTVESRASNGFGLRAYTGGTFSLCTTISGASGYSATCPQIHALTDMSIFANISGSQASFYLAQVDPVHAGKTMRITLFDTGEGASQLEILDPNGNPAQFSWSTPCNPPTAPSGGCSANNVNALNVSGTGTQPYTGLQSTSKYNDRSMVLDIHLPNNYAALYGTNTWWKVRYTTASAPTDRTTWSASIVGDPVHLVG
jgi:Flp pilus assembly protein TadG